MCFVCAAASSKEDISVMEGEERTGEGYRPSRLSALQEQLVWALLDSGLSRDVLVQALGELEQERVASGGEKVEKGDGESSEEGEMDFPPPIFRELERLPPEEAARQRAEVDQLLQYVDPIPYGHSLLETLL